MFYSRKTRQMAKSEIRHPYFISRLKHVNEFKTMNLFKKPKKIKTFFTIAILSLGIIIGGILVLSSKTSQSEKNIIVNNESANQDSDQYGLLDWEEEIYQTDPNNPDTDNDGYLDGEEIATGYDPTKPAPNDKLSEKAIEPRPAKGALAADSNFTQLLLKNIVAGLMTKTLNPGSSEENPALLNPASQEILDQFISRALSDSSQIFLPQIKESELKISNDNSRQALKNYLTTYSQIILKELEKPEFEKTEMAEVFLAIQSKDFSGLDKRINAYKNTYQEMKNILVPSQALKIHKLELQILLISLNTFQAVKNIDQDPLKALLAIQNHPITISLAQEMVKKIDELIVKEIAQ